MVTMHYLKTLTLKGRLKMGQRHQIYAVLPYTFQQLKEEVWKEGAKKEYIESNTVALYHGWFYGTLPLRQLKQVFKFYEKGKNEQYHIFNESGQYCSGSPEDALKSLYSIDLESGGYHSVLVEPNIVAQDPRRADNNDGITVIDFRKEKEPKYAFMFFDDYDGERIPYQPLSAEQYVRSYYNDNYYKEHEKSEEYKQKWEKEIKKLVSFFDDYAVLTQAELEDIFPIMFKKNAQK